jgi:PIN domain nuclease of toxin-antitoxin system
MQWVAPRSSDSLKEWSEVPFDTHWILWAAAKTGHLSPAAGKLMRDGGNELTLSAASFGETAIKRNFGGIDPLPRHSSKALRC